VNIHFDRDRAATRRFDFGDKIGGGVYIPNADRDICAGLGKRQGAFTPKTFCRAGDEGRLAN
jgi:hypothetical protein